VSLSMVGAWFWVVAGKRRLTFRNCCAGERTHADTVVGRLDGPLSTSATKTGRCPQDSVTGLTMVGAWFWVFWVVAGKRTLTFGNCWRAGGRTFVSFGTPVGTSRRTFDKCAMRVMVVGGALGGIY
jgi:hypothetical protein